MTAGLPLDVARTLLDRVVAEAAALAVRISVVVVDAVGDDVAALRMDGAPGFTPAVARAKARSAVRMRQDSGDLAALKADYPELVDLIGDQAGFRLTTLPGAVVLRRGDDVAGAIAVSGAHPDVDVRCAEAGRSLWEKLSTARGGRAEVDRPRPQSVALAGAGTTWTGPSCRARRVQASMTSGACCTRTCPQKLGTS